MVAVAESLQPILNPKAVRLQTLTLQSRFHISNRIVGMVRDSAEGASILLFRCIFDRVYSMLREPAGHRHLIWVSCKSTTVCRCIRMFEQSSKHAQPTHLLSISSVISHQA